MPNIRSLLPSYQDLSSWTTMLIKCSLCRVKVTQTVVNLCSNPPSVCLLHLPNLVYPWILSKCSITSPKIIGPIQHIKQIHCAKCNITECYLKNRFKYFLAFPPSISNGQFSQIMFSHLPSLVPISSFIQKNLTISF